VADRGPAIDAGSKTDWNRKDVFIRASGLTFDLSGWPQASPLEGRVRALLGRDLAQYKPWRGSLKPGREV
jgi:hypothetical protein